MNPSDVCKCGAPTRLTDNTLRIGTRILGCKACNYTGKPIAPKGTKS